MAIYDNPYGDDGSYDPAKARRTALLDLLGTPTRPVASASQALPSSSSDATSPGDPGPSTTPPPATTPAPTHAGTPPTPNPYTASDPTGLGAGSSLLPYYTAGYQPRGVNPLAAGGYGSAGSGALHGAETGATIGMYFGGVGAPVGAGIGALAGGITGAVNHHADSAPTDYSVDDAKKIVQQEYQDAYGRAATDQEVNDALTGQGLKPGDEWVGSQGLQGVLGHIYQNAAAEKAAAAASSSATAGTTADGTSTTPASGTSSSTTSTPTGGGGGDMSGLEGYDAGNFNDPTKSDPKYDFGHIVAGVPPTPAGLDSVWDQVLAKFPNAKRVSDDTVDFGDGSGPVDVIRAAGDGGKAWHWEPTADASAADSTASSPAPSTAPAVPTTPGATGLAPALTNNDVLQQILEQVRRVQAGQQPRAEILAQMGLPNG